MKVINKFLKGIRKFKDFSLYDNTEWTFPTINIRISKSDNGGFIITPIKSNTVAAQIKENYSVIGACEYAGFVFIVSTINDNTGLSEIGIYPSPKIWSTTEQEIVNEYKPLYNFHNGTSVGDFNTSLLGYTTKNEVEIIAKEIRDDSINLYISDFKNIIRVINTGFSIYTGALTGKYITTYSFEGRIDFIINSNKYPQFIYKGLSEGGNNKPGSYELFFRYVDDTFNRTSYIENIFPIVVGNLGNRKISSGVNDVDIHGNTNYISSSINLEVTTSTLDLGYKYIEISVIRTNYSETGILSYESYIIDKLYSISGLLTYNSIIINGNETKLMTDKNEILQLVIDGNINKTHTSVKSRYFGGNWKGYGYDINSLKAYAELINVNYEFSARIDDEEIYNNTTSAMNFDNAFHKINELGVGKTTYDYTGYFRGEIVPFGVVFILKGSYITEAFPINGGDYFDITGNEFDELTMYGNVKGLLRFPEINSDNKDVDIRVSDLRYQLGVSFDNTSAISILTNEEYDFSNIIGFYFVRGERISNLIYQGLLIGASTKVLSFADNDFECKTMIPIISEYFADSIQNTYTEGSDVVIPNISLQYDTDHNLSSISRNGKYVQVSREYYSLIVPDYIFSLKGKTSDLKNIKMRIVKKFININKVFINAVDYNPPISYYEINEAGYPTNIPEYPDTIYDVDIYHVTQGSYNEGMFSSYIRDGWNEINNLYDYTSYIEAGEIYYNYHNRSMFFPSYIGIKVIDFHSETYDIYNSIVNIYKEENTYDPFGITGFYKTTRDYYNVASNVYWKITDIKLIDSDVSSQVVFKGDCFINRTIVRLQHTFENDGNEGSSDYTVTGSYANGIMLSILTENEINIAMRSEVQAYDPDNNSNIFNYTYFPSLLNRGIILQQWLTHYDEKQYLYEALSINQSYNKTDSYKYILGIDFERSYNELKFNTRIYFSGRSIKNELTDNYRNIGKTSYIDLDVCDGEIIKLLNFNDNLISVQEQSINHHMLGAKKLDVENSSTEVLLNESGLFLNQDYTKLSNFGSQHQNSIISTDNAIYGIDMKKGLVIWRLAAGQGGLQVKDISTEKEIKGWIDELLLATGIENYMSLVEDNPVNSIGITSGYNETFKEIYFTFHLRQRTFDLIVINPVSHNTKLYSSIFSYQLYETFYFTGNDSWYYVTTAGTISLLHGVPPPISTRIIKKENVIIFIPGMKCYVGRYYLGYNSTLERYMVLVCFSTMVYSSFNDLFTSALSGSYGANEVLIIYREPIQRTLIFSEYVDAFIGEYSKYPAKYFNLNKSLFTTRPTLDLVTRNIYEQDKGSNYLNFFGSNEVMQLSFIVNGGQDAGSIIKYFASYEIGTNNNYFQKIEFFTENMEGLINPFMVTAWNQEYLKPEYIENRWKGPIPFDTLSLTSDYMVEEYLKGLWLKVVISFNRNDYIYIRDFITNINQSYI